MKKNQAPHVALGAAFATLSVGTPTQIACAQTLVMTTSAMWFEPEHRGVVTDGLSTLRTNVEAGRASGKRELLTSIGDLMKSIAVQSPEPPHVQNGAGDQPHQAMPREQRATGVGGH